MIKKETSIVRSSAAEYLTFVAATGKGAKPGNICRGGHNDCHKIV